MPVEKVLVYGVLAYFMTVLVCGGAILWFVFTYRPGLGDASDTR